MKESKKLSALTMVVTLLLGTLGAVMMCRVSSSAAQGLWAVVALLCLAVFAFSFDWRGRHA